MERALRHQRSQTCEFHGPTATRRLHRSWRAQPWPCLTDPCRCAVTTDEHVPQQSTHRFVLRERWAGRSWAWNWKRPARGMSLVRWSDPVADWATGRIPQAKVASSWNDGSCGTGLPPLRHTVSECTHERLEKVPVHVHVHVHVKLWNKKKTCLFIPECSMQHGICFVHGSRRSRPERFRRPRGICAANHAPFASENMVFWPGPGVRSARWVWGRRFPPGTAPWPTHRRPRSRRRADWSGGRSRCPVSLESRCRLTFPLTCRLVPCFAVLQLVTCQAIEFS